MPDTDLSAQDTTKNKTTLLPNRTSDSSSPHKDWWILLHKCTRCTDGTPSTLGELSIPQTYHQSFCVRDQLSLPSGTFSNPLSAITCLTPSLTSLYNNQDLAAYFTEKRICKVDTLSTSHTKFNSTCVHLSLFCLFSNFIHFISSNERERGTLTTGLSCHVHLHIQPAQIRAHVHVLGMF